MRKILFCTFIISGVLSIIAFATHFLALGDITNSLNKALAKGNSFYAEEDYQNALITYQEALDIYKEGKLKEDAQNKLNFNSGLCEYRLENYQEALDYYQKTPTQLEKYLKSGNSLFKLGDGIDEPSEKLTYYKDALEFYKEGIIEFPDNVDIKYNYEFVKKLIDELEQSQNQQEDENNSDNSENEDENQEDSEDGQQDDQHQEDNQGDDSDEQNDNDEQSNDEQSNDENNSEDQSEESDDNQDQSEDQQQGDQDEQDNEETDSSQNELDGDEQHNNSSDQSEAEMEDLSQVQRVLEMLEKLEEESLKNNQGVEIEGGESKYDW